MSSQFFLFAVLQRIIYQGENWNSLKIGTEYLILKLYKLIVDCNLTEIQEGNTALCYK